ncbi:MAG: hypothetical protein SF187_06365 [Deltaproteobacteria bacterium]|nr:hypothetical protein [Deltaproteobacteria bacterium]
MSDSSHHNDPHKPHITTEDPNAGVNAKLIVAVGAVSLIAFIASAIVAYIMLVRDEKTIASAGPQNPTEQFRKRKEIGIVDFVHYDADDRLPTLRSDLAAKLNGYSWVDKSKAKVRLPIAEGIKRAIAEAASGAAIGEANAKVEHEPKVPRLTLAEAIANPAAAQAAAAAKAPPSDNSVPKPTPTPKAEVK